MKESLGLREGVFVLCKPLKDLSISQGKAVVGQVIPISEQGEERGISTQNNWEMILITPMSTIPIFLFNIRFDKCLRPIAMWLMHYYSLTNKISGPGVMGVI